MTDPMNDDPMEEEEENFADLLDTYSTGLISNLQVGDKISGKIIAIGKETVFVDTGSKIDGAADMEELLDENRNLPYQEGDVIELYVVAVGESEIRLSRAISGIGGLNILMDAYDNAIPVEGKIKESCKGGFNVEILQRRAFCPISQVDLKYVEDSEAYIGKNFQFLITQFEENGRNIVVSRRKLLEIGLEKERGQFLSQLTMGSILKGQIKKLMPYGAFIELSPGVEGMAHISELSWSRVQRPEDIVKEGDAVTVKVIGFEAADQQSRQPKIALSMKQLTEDPWTSVAEKFRVGDKVKGTVTRCAKFGAFIEIAPGIEGLVHISEMSYKTRVLKAEDIVQPGDPVSILIKEINEESRRISLSLRDAEGDPWIDIENKYGIGQSVKGMLEKRETFGLFISLEPGITGLLPKSKISYSSAEKLVGKLKEGDAIPVTIVAIDPRNRKITLSPGDSSDETEWKNYAKHSDISIGSLGEKLQAALKPKKIQ